MAIASKGNRLHIGIFGRRNAGKSSLINAVTDQEIALVSNVAGTTTDPVHKAMEILPIGPCSLIDTAGLDDTGELGLKRVKRSRQILNKTDFVLIVVSSEIVNKGELSFEEELIKDIKLREIPVILVINKIDLEDVASDIINKVSAKFSIPVVKVSAFEKTGIEELKKEIVKNNKEDWISPTILGDLIDPGDLVFLVCPIDNAAPKGRLILPQVQTIRDILDNDAMSLVVKERELAHAFRTLGKPKLVVTDSQEFQKVSADTPEDVLMTSFSILFARYKGDLELFLKGINRIKELKSGDRILISEACTHHAQSDDIGTVKIPRWLRQLTGVDLEFDKVSGANFPENLKDYRLVIHCGACMLNRREMLYRLKFSDSESVPVVNYGMLIAYVHGILDRALKPFPMAREIYENNGEEVFY